MRTRMLPREKNHRVMEGIRGRLLRSVTTEQERGGTMDESSRSQARHRPDQYIDRRVLRGIRLYISPLPVHQF